MRMASDSFQCSSDMYKLGYSSVFACFPCSPGRQPLRIWLSCCRFVSGGTVENAFFCMCSCSPVCSSCVNIFSQTINLRFLAIWSLQYLYSQRSNSFFCKPCGCQLSSCFLIFLYLQHCTNNPPVDSQIWFVERFMLVQIGIVRPDVRPEIVTSTSRWVSASLEASHGASTSATYPPNQIGAINTITRERYGKFALMRVKSSKILEPRDEHRKTQQWDTLRPVLTRTRDASGHQVHTFMRPRLVHSIKGVGSVGSVGRAAVLTVWGHPGWRLTFRRSFRAHVNQIDR